MRHLEHFPNLVAMFLARAREKGDAPFLWAKQQGAWRPTSWRQAADQVMRLAAALHEHGAKSDLMESRAAFAEKRTPQFKGWNDPADRYRLPTLDLPKA